MSISKTNRLDPRAVKANCRSVRRVSSATWLESLEHRRLLATFTVTNTIDAGTGSLRQALVNANATAASDTILFNIPGTGPHTIAPISQLPLITQPVVIDATSEVLPNGTRGIELDGSLAGLADGLIIQSGNVTVRGLVINQFSDSGIKFISNVGTQNGLVTGCYIGTDPTGMMALGNGGDGIEMTQSSGVIGGALASERNIISANGDRGVRVTGSLAGITLVIGNYIGVAADGVTDLGNAQHGVQLSSSDNRVGGAGGQRNVISGNGGDGVRIERQIFGAQFGPEANENTVVGNYIGTDVTGEIAIRNEFQGVHIINGSGNTIGGAETGLRNVISGNRRRGVTITAVSALNLAGFSQNNVVIGNYIGLSASGAAMGNLRSGVVLEEVQGTSESFVLSNRIGGSAAGEGNVIGGNTSSGIAAQLGSAGTTIEGNFIGTDPTGTQARPNGEAGVALIDSQGNTVGGPSASQRNVISGNDDDGVRILTIGEASTPANSNTVLNNYIGTNATGTAALPNSLYGVRIIGGSNNQIGDAFLTGNAGNVISGNGLGGIGIGVDTPDFEEAGTTANNVIQNNRIGTNAAGNAAIPNTGHGIFVTQIGGIIIEGGTNILTSGTMIGSAGITITQGGNLISGNGADGLHNGIRIENGPFNTTILGNRIGTNASGNAALGNFGSGIQIRQSSSTTIGSTAGGGGNIIAGNGGAGIIAFGDTNTVDTAIVANAIGTNFAGTVDMGNGGSGIVISGTLNNIDRNVMIGGATNAAGNRIAFNNFGGVSVSNGAGIEITRNRIYSNDNGLGIDLGALGITPNDTGDGDLGANNLQNFPVLAPVTQVGTDVTIPTALNSTASTTFRIDYYAVVAPDPSGSGEGNFYLGSANVTTNGSGNMTTFPTFSLANAPGATAVTATATRQGTFSDTSEFAANRLIADNFAPTLVGEASFVFDADVQSLNYLFNENVGGSLTTADFILENLTTSQIIPSANISVSYNADFNRATFTFPGYTNGVLPDGNYRATLVADGINDPSGNDLAGGDDVSEFFFLNGDVNRDRFVDFNDLLVVAQNYGVSGRTFTQGNVNYSVGGLVDFNDVLIIAQKYGVELPLIRARGPLGNTRINDDVLSITDFSRFQI